MSATKRVAVKVTKTVSVNAKNGNTCCGILVGGIAVSIGVGVLFGAGYGWIAVGVLILLGTVARRRYD